MDRIVGSASEAEVTLDGNKCTTLLDSGSTVSTVSESYYRQLIRNKLVQPLDELLNIE